MSHIVVVTRARSMNITLRMKDERYKRKYMYTCTYTHLRLTATLPPNRCLSLRYVTEHLVEMLVDSHNVASDDHLHATESRGYECE